MPESEGFNTSYSDPSLNDSTAVTHIAVIGGHLYGASPFTYTNALNHGKQVWMTEHYIGSGPDIGSAMTLAKEINDCMDNNMSAYLWWWAYYPGNATNLLNGSTILLTGYVMGQYAKFVRPGYVRVNTTYNPQGNVYLSAYTGSGKVVVVAVNTATSSVNQTISFSGGTVSSVTPYQTSSSQSMAQLSSIGVSNGAFTATLPAQSVTTFVGNLGSAGISNGNHTLTPQNATGSRLDANASGTSNGTKVQIWQASGGANQNWSFTNQGGSIYTVSPAYDTGLCLDVSGSGTANGTTVQLWGCWNGANQQWGAISDGGNIYEFAPQNAAGERLDVTGASSANGTQVEIWQSNGGSNQKWAVN
jgi:glucuronoarabinoxylan endo-1,4-beta-xylanase